MNYRKLLEMISFIPPILFGELKNTMILERNYYKLLEMLRKERKSELRGCFGSFGLKFSPCYDVWMLIKRTKHELIIKL